jgi:hypothetical protein
MEYVDELISRWCRLHDQRKQLDAQLDALAELITPELHDGQRRSGVVAVAPKRFSARLAKERLTAEDYDRICEQRPSASKAERLLGSDIADLCREQSGSRHLRRSDDD